MSDPELNERPAHGLTESCPIPNASAQQETQPDLGTSVLSHGSELVCPERYQSPFSSVRSKSYNVMPSPELQQRVGPIDDRPENAKSHPPPIAAPSPPTPNDSPDDLNLPSEQSTSNEEQLTEVAQEEDPGASFVLVPNGNLMPIVAQREYYSSPGELSGFVNLLIEEESSVSTAKREGTQSSGAYTCSDNTANEDKAEIHRDPSTDNIGEDDGLPFQMDDVNECAPTTLQDGDQVEYKPTGLFTGSLPLSFGNDSNIRPALTTCNVASESNHMQQNGSENSATPTPTQRSPSTSNASEMSTASISSQSSVLNRTEGKAEQNIY